MAKVFMKVSFCLAMAFSISCLFFFGMAWLICMLFDSMGI